MKRRDCARIQQAFRSGSATPADQRHLFGCAECRVEVRLGQAWKTLPRPADLESRPEADEVFVQRVLRDVREDRRRRARVRAGLAAAAALLFFFLAGAAGQIAASANSADDDVSMQLAGPADADTDLVALLPE